MIRRPVVPRLVATAILIALAQGCGSGGATTPPPTITVASVSLTPATDTLVPGQTAQLTATPKDASGATVSGQTIIWSTSPTTIATVNDVGVVTGVAAGTATVTATTGGKSATANVTVTAGAMVTVSGGTVANGDGSVSFAFPAQAVSTTTPVSIRPAVTFPASNNLIGSPYDFGPTGTQFAQPVTVHVKYDPGAVPASAVPALIQLYTVTNGAWAVVPGSSVDTVAHSVSATLSHFSIYSPCIYGCAPPNLSRVSVDVIPSCFSFGPQCNLNVPVGGTSGLMNGTVGIPGIGPGPDNGPFPLTIGPLPAGVIASFSSTGTNTWSLSFSATAAAVPGVYGTYVLAGYTGSYPLGQNTAAVGIDVTVQAPGYTITPGASGFSVAQGGNTSTSITLARTFWTPDVTLSGTNLPAGVTTSFAPPTISGTASTMTLNVGASTVPGNYTITIRGTSPSHSDVTTPIGLTVTPGTGFTIAGTPAFATVAQGSSGSTGLQVTRVNFSNSIAYTFTGLPTGVTAAVTSTTVADSNKLTFTATSGATPGTYPITVTGTSGATVRSTTISLVVASPGITIVQADFSNCNPSQRPVWVVYQDGNGPFTQAGGSGNVFPITFTSARGAIAAVIPVLGGGSFTTVVNYGTPAELLTLPWNCNDVAFGGGKTIGVSATGMLPNDFGDIGMGGASDGSLTFGGPTIPVDSTTLNGVAAGLQDLIAYRYHSTIPGTDIRWAIRRDQNIPTGGAAATISFTGPESFAAVAGNFSVVAGSEQATMQFGYITAPGCTSVRYAVDINGVSAPQSGNTFYGVPAAQQRPGDLHVISVSTPTRFAANYFHTVTQATVALNLGGGMPTPTITAPSGPYKRLQAVFSRPSDYVFTRFWYGAGVIQAATGYFGSGTTTLAMPDLTGVAGYTPAWFPAGVNTPFPWTLSGYSTINQATQCVDGGSVRSSGTSGTN